MLMLETILISPIKINILVKVILGFSRLERFFHDYSRAMPDI